MQYVDTGGINTDELEFDSLNLNSRVINRITNNTINTYSETHTFTGHGAILWRGSFLVLLEEMMAQTIETLQSLIHPATHPADMIEETVDRLWMTPAEKDKLTGVEYGANNYTHPATHSLDIITSTDTRKILTVTEKTKLDGVEENANNYTHPATHELGDFYDLFDVDGYLQAPLPKYTYLGDRHFIPMEIDINLGTVDLVINNVYGVDMVSYIGAGLDVEIPVNYRLGFNDIPFPGLFVSFNYSPGYDYTNVVTPFNKYAAISDTSYIIPGDRFIVTDAGVVDKITSANKLTATLGFKCNRIETNYDVPDGTGDWYYGKSSFQRSVYRSSARKIGFFNYHTTNGNVSLCLSRVYTAGTYKFNLTPSWNDSVTQEIPFYHYSVYCYSSDPIPSKEYTNILIQYDHGTSLYGPNFRIMYQRHTFETIDTSFKNLTNASNNFKHANFEVVNCVCVAPYIAKPVQQTSTIDEHAKCPEYLVSFTTMDEANSKSWITIYRINLVAKTVVLFQTISLNYKLFNTSLTYIRHMRVLYSGYGYSNLLSYWGNNNIYIYSRYYYTNNTFVLRHTVPAAFIEASLPSDVFKSLYIQSPLVTDRIKLVFKSKNYLYLLNISTIQIGVNDSFIPTFVTGVNPQWDFKYNQIGFAGNTIPMVGDDIVKLSYVPPSNDYTTIYHPIAAVDMYATTYTTVDIYSLFHDIRFQRLRMERSSSYPPKVDMTYSSDSYQPRKLYVSIDTGVMVEYTYEPQRILYNDLIWFLTWNKNYQPSVGNMRVPSNKTPIVVFCFNISKYGSMPHKNFVMIYNGKQYSVDAISTGYIGQDGPYGECQPLNVTQMSYINNNNRYLQYIDIPETLEVYSKHGNQLIYFGFFGESYQIEKNNITSDVDGVPGKTCIFTASAGDSVNVNFTPNIIMLREENTDGSVKVLFQNIGFDKYIDWNGSVLHNTQLLEVDNTTITMGAGIDDMIVIVIGMNANEVISDLSINASGLNPFFASLNDGFNSIGERDKTFTKTENTIPVIYDLGEGEVNHYLSINKFGDFTLNNKDGLLNYEWSKPDDMLFHGTNDFQPSVSEGASHLPLAKIRAVDGVINEVIPTAKDTSYTTSWKLLNEDSMIVFENKYMTEQIFIEVQYKGNLIDETVVLSGTTNIHLSHDSIKVSSMLYPEIIPGFTSAYVRLIVKRLF